jgi:hypothetical protein
MLITIFEIVAKRVRPFSSLLSTQPGLSLMGDGYNQIIQVKSLLPEIRIMLLFLFCFLHINGNPSEDRKRWRDSDASVIF